MLMFGAVALTVAVDSTLRVAVAVDVVDVH